MGLCDKFVPIMDKKWSDFVVFKLKTLFSVRNGN